MILEKFFLERLKLHVSLTLNSIGLHNVDLYPLGPPYSRNHGHIMWFGIDQVITKLTVFRKHIFLDPLMEGQINMVFP